MKIAIISQTVLNRGQEKAKPLVQRAEKAKLCTVAIPLSQKTSKL